jgi:hypothetical protein
MRSYLLASFVLALSACAASEQTQVAAAAPVDPATVHLECHQQSDAGSFLIHKVCTRTQDSNPAEMARTSDQILHSLPNASLYHLAPGTPGGVRPTNN